MDRPVPAWFRPRGYLHFDPQIRRAQSVMMVITDARAVAKHAFYPLIRCVLRIRRYKPQKRKTVDKERTIAYAAHMDAHILAYYAHLLCGVYEKQLAGLGIEDSVIAYRTFPERKCNIHFANEAFDAISRIGECRVIAMDVESFFDTMDHDLLKQRWCELLGVPSLPDDHYAVYRAVTRYAYVDQDKLVGVLGRRSGRTSGARRLCTTSTFRERVRPLVEKNTSGKGIPQGSPISAVLSNIYMMEFDKQMAALVQEHGAFYRRYSDDILVISPAASTVDFEKAITEILSRNLLEPSMDKTARSVFRLDSMGGLVADRPVQYLGFTFDGARKLIRSATVARYQRRMRTGVYRAMKRAEKRGEDRLHKRHLYMRYSHLSRERSYPEYMRRATKLMGSAIKRQHAKNWSRLNQMIAEAEGMLGAGT